MALVPKASSSKYSTVTVASQVVTLPMKAGKLYRFSSNTDCFIKQANSADSPVASAADACVFVPAKSSLDLSGSYGDSIAVIRDTADGKSTLQAMEIV